MLGIRLCAAASLAVVSVFCSAPRSADAVDDAKDPLSERIEALEERVERQQEEIDGLNEETDETSLDAALASERSAYNPSRSWRQAYGFFAARVEVHGFINLEFVKAGPDGARSGQPTFDLHHANVFVDALLRPNLRSHIEIEFEHAFEDVEIDQAFLAWGLTDWLTFTAGRFYAPFGIERFAWYPPVNHMVSRPMPFRSIIPGNFYQQGLMVSGEIRPTDAFRLSYETSISNGLGGEQGVSDPVTDRRKSRQSRNNNSKLAVTSRLGVIFWPWLEVGASVHSQQFNSTGDAQDLLFLGADAAARWQGFELRGEYVYASLDRIDTTVLYQGGWYTQLGYMLDLQWRHLDSAVFAIRVDQVELDRNDSDEHLRVSLASALQIYEHFRIKAEYQFAMENGPDLDNDAFLAAFVVDF